MARRRKQDVLPTDTWDTGWNQYASASGQAPSQPRGPREFVPDPNAPQAQTPYSPEGTNTAITEAAGQAIQEDFELNHRGYGALGFTDKVEAGFNQGIIPTLVGSLYEEATYGWHAMRDKEWGKAAPLNLTKEMTDGLTEAELEELESSHNQEHALFKLERMRAVQQDHEALGKGSIWARIAAPMVGSLPESVALGLVGGAGGAAIGAKYGRHLYQQTGSVAKAVAGQRVVGGVAGNVLSGVVPETLALTWDPYRGWEDVVGAAFFDAAGSIGALRGAIPNQTNMELLKGIGNKVLNLKTSLEDWVRTGKTGLPTGSKTPELQPENVKAETEALIKEAEAAQRAREAAQKAADGSPDPTTKAPEPAASKGLPEAPEAHIKPDLLAKLEDVSWASRSELDNLGVTTYVSPEGKVLHNDGTVSIFDLPEGTVDTATGVVSRGGDTPALELPSEVQAFLAGTGDTPLPVEGAKWADSVEAKVQDHIRVMQEQLGYARHEALLSALHKLRPHTVNKNLKWNGTLWHEAGESPDLVELATAIHKDYGDPNSALVLTRYRKGDPQDADGRAYPFGHSLKYVELADDLEAAPQIPGGDRTTQVFLHEYGHTLLLNEFKLLPKHLQEEYSRMVTRMQALMKDPKRFIVAARARFGLGTGYMVRAYNTDPGLSLMAWLNDENYYGNWDEIGAQQFYKHAQRRYGELFYKGKKGVPMSKAIAKWVQLTIGKFKDLILRTATDPDEKAIAEMTDAVFLGFMGLRRQVGPLNYDASAIDALLDHLPKTEPRYAENFTTVGRAPGSPKPADPVIDPEEGLPPNAIKSAYQISPEGQLFGLGNTNMDTPEEVAGVILMDRIVQRAVREAPPPNQESRKSKILRSKALKDTFFGENFVSASQIALESKDPVIRWAAHVLAESPSNLTGSRNNRSAAAVRVALEREIAGDSLYRLREAKKEWYAEQGIPAYKALLSGEHTEKFNKELQYWLYETYSLKEIPPGIPPSLQKAVETLAEFHDRANKVEQRMGVVGTRDTVPDSLGYMKRILDPTKISQLSVDQKQKVIAAIQAQLRAIGFDAAVAKRVATRYLDRAEKARGGVFTPQEAALDSPDAVRTLQELLEGEGFKPEEIQALTGPILNRKDKHFHRKLDLDENLDLGGGITLGDLMWNDHESMLRDRARSAAGWSAMASVGIHGYEGMRALMAAAGKGKGTRKEIEALQQIVSEVSSVPLEGRYYSAALDGAAAATAAIRLGGIGWTSVAEIFNVANHVGAANAITGIKDIPELVKEVRATVKGEKVANPFLSEMEQYLGHSFGTDGYFLASPWDDNGKNRDLQGSEQSSRFVRNINAVGHATQVLSGFRIITATSQRYAAQQTVEQALNRILSMQEPDTWLKDIGIEKDLFDRLKAALPGTVERGPDGKVSYFHAKRLDPDLLNDLSLTVFRSVNQMIQGTFAGERGAYVHDSFWRVMTQFRGYSITALEKQIGRQAANYGYTKVALMLAANIAAALPLVILRTYVSAMGREESAREKYLESALSWPELIQKASTYTALSGLSSDLMDVLQDATGTNVHGTRAIGDRIAPAAGLVNDAYGAFQNPYKAMNLAPGASLPFVVPAMNLFKAEAREFSQGLRE